MKIFKYFRVSKKCVFLELPLTKLGFFSKVKCTSEHTDQKLKYSSFNFKICGFNFKIYGRTGAILTR